jgi:hypothetical protein
MQSVHVGVAGVAKKANPGMPHAVATELLCANLARSLLLPVPPSFIVEDGAGVPYHVSLNFALAGQNLPPADTAALVAAHPHLACGIVMFDVWVGNIDRHNGNIAFDQIGNKVNVFDHSHAFASGVDVAAWLNANLGQIGIGGHCLCPHIQDVTPMVDWHARIAGVPEFFIRGAVKEMTTVGLPQPMETPCADHLVHRRGQLINLLKANAAMFPNVPAAQWAQI